MKTILSSEGKAQLQDIIRECKAWKTRLPDFRKKGACYAYHSRGSLV